MEVGVDSLESAEEDRKRATKLLKAMSKTVDVKELSELVLPYFNRVAQLTADVEEFKMNVVSMLEQQEQKERSNPTKRRKAAGETSWHVNPFLIYSTANRGS